MLFQYAQLAPGAIRLVRFHSRSTSSDIHITLEHQPRFYDDDVHYSVVSYKPSSSGDRKGLTLNGRTRMIDSNAWRMLSDVCGTGRRDERFWIDVLSINQGDEGERRGQMAMLERIYASADQVLLGIDVAEDEMKEALSAIDRGLEPSMGDGNAIAVLLKQAEDQLAGATDELALRKARKIVLLHGDHQYNLDLLRTREKRKDKEVAHGSL